MRIHLLHVPDCPNVDLTRSRVLDALDAIGVEGSVSQAEVATDAAAAATGMHGSPTILIDGIDAFPSPVTEPSLSCRLFRTPQDLEGSPTVAQLVEAIVGLVPISMQTGDGCCAAGLLCERNDEVARAFASNGFASIWGGTAPHPSSLVVRVQRLLRSGGPLLRREPPPSDHPFVRW